MATINHKIFLQIQYYYNAVGTEITAGPLTILKAETTYIGVRWSQPKYSPVTIRVDYQYSLLCKEQPYYKQKVYLPFDYYGMNFTKMKPGNLCKVNYAVLYYYYELCSIIL